MNATLDHISAALNDCDENSPFRLENEGAYRAWRARKLESRRQLHADRVFAVAPDAVLSRSLREQLRRQVDAFNFAIIETRSVVDKRGFVEINRQFGLKQIDSNPGADADSVTSLRVVDDADERAQYIPYTNRALNWHTDGYYNPDGRRINAFALYCVNQAERGGGNYLFDHELMYLLIRDQSPELLASLMAHDLMRIPPNIQNNRVVRAEESGPVFSIQPGSCKLNMRYTSRPRNIVWKSDKRSERALNLVREILMDGEAGVEIRLQPRQGVICNNLLHGRQAFHDDARQPPRLIYRARYYDAIDLDRGPDLQHAVCQE
ncbi:MAG: TauD/TfdA family dioxygenase [Gammaproteobacteria bacterium]|nr:TauD/TfdA family dioxygenase [Gammaproteobacteria bacterium]